MRIKELPEDERPREKLARHGAASLSDAELLALFFRTGLRGKSAIELGRELIRAYGSLRNLSRASVDELTALDGIGPAKASHLAAMFEFGNRLAREPHRDRPITSPDEVFDLVGPEMQGLSQESVRAILLNHRKHLIHVTEVFRGTGNESFANPPEILRHAVGRAASALILVHNHPSGDPSPSRADHDVTHRLKAACDAIGVEFTDHIVIGCHSDSRESPYFSFREAGLL